MYDFQPSKYFILYLTYVFQACSVDRAEWDNNDMKKDFIWIGDTPDDWDIP